MTGPFRLALACAFVLICPYFLNARDPARPGGAPPTVQFGPVVATGGQTLPAPRLVRDELDELNLRPPSPSELFRVRSETALRDAQRAAAAARGLRERFPAEAPAPSDDVPPRKRLPAMAVYPSTAVCHGQLYFNGPSPRAAAARPALQPLLFAGRFYLDVLLLPVRMCQTPPGTCTCDAPLPPIVSYPFVD